MTKKTLDDYRFELNIYLQQSDCPNSFDFIEAYEKALRENQPVKYKHIGLLRIPLDLYQACQAVVPSKKLQQFEQRLYHTLATTSNQNTLKIINVNTIKSFQDLLEEYSNVTTEEAKKHYN